MTKRLVDIDDETLEQARALLGTSTLKDTVNRSLRLVVDGARRGIASDDWVWFGDAASDLRDPDVMRAAWE